MVQFDLHGGGHVYIAPEHAESVRAGEGHGAELSSLVTLTSGEKFDVLGGTYEVSEKLSRRAPLTVEKAKEIGGKV